MVWSNQSARDEEKELVEATLAWCNERRGEKGMPPLGALPKGEREDPASCPCGKATGLYVDHATWGESEETKNAHQLPELVSRFVVEFDEGRFPELDIYPPRDDDEDGYDIVAEPL